MRHSVIIFFFVILQLVGCSTPQETETLISLTSNSIDATADGVSVIDIRVAPNGEDIREQLKKYGEPIESELQSKLFSEGIYVRKVSSIDLPAIVASVGDVIEETTVWHGQIFKWRDLHQRRIESQGMLISEQGIPYFIERGYLSLLGRSWLLEGENGLHLYLQFLPTWHIPNHQATFVGSSKPPLRIKLFRELEVEILLQNNEAIVVATHLIAPNAKSGPQDDGPPPVRLGEALLGGPVKEDLVQFLVIEANIMPRG
jgi:hypothetical protein